MAPTSTPAPVAYLRSLDAVRDRSKQVFDLVVAGKADHWDWHEEKLDDVVDYCLNIIKVSLALAYLLLSGDSSSSETSDKTTTR
jgi:hypothetical protein